MPVLVVGCPCLRLSLYLRVRVCVCVSVPVSREFINAITGIVCIVWGLIGLHFEGVMSKFERIHNNSPTIQIRIPNSE